MSPRIRRPVPIANLLVPALFLAGPSSDAAEKAAVPREGLETLEAQLDKAVGQVSRPAPGIVLGRAEAARGYHLPGYGAVFVLTPRALPREGNVLVWQQRVPPPGAARIHIETRVQGPVGDDEAERMAEQARRRVLAARRAHGPAPASSPGPEKIEDPEGDELVAIEQEVLEFQREAEAARQSAEREFDRITRDIRERLAVPPEDPGSPVVPGAPVPPTVPPAPSTKGVMAPSALSTPPRAVPPPAAMPAPPAAPGEVPLPPPPPWRFWFEAEGPADDRPPAQVVADVRAAVIATLESEGPRIKGLAPAEYVAVAIDFVPGGIFVSRARPARTLVIRAQKQDLDARQAGRLSSEELRSRVETSEY